MEASSSSSTLIREAALVAIDFESAGLLPGETTYPIEVGIAPMRALRFESSLFFRSYLRTASAIAWKAQHIHKIEPHHLRDAPSMQELWPEFQQRLQARYLVAHGRGTERRFLRAFPMHGFGPWIDTLTLSRKLVPGLRSYRLSALLEQFGLLEKVHLLLPDFRWHEALSDALASLVLLLYLLERANLFDQSIHLFIQE